MLDKLKSIFSHPKVRMFRPLLIHLLLAVTVFITVLFLFFNVYLPWATNHGESITVPDVTGLHVDQMDEKLKNRNLRYEVEPDSGFTTELPPLTVLEQFPKANSQVKENRRIQLVLNARMAPLVALPDLSEKTTKVAPRILKSLDLKVGKFIPYPGDLNQIYGQEIDGQVIQPGTKIPQGTVVDLLVGDGRGSGLPPLGQFIDMNLEEAMVAILGVGLTLGEVKYENDNRAVISLDSRGNSIPSQVIAVQAGDVVRQYPSPGQPVRVGDRVDLWVYDQNASNP